MCKYRPNENAFPLKQLCVFFRLFFTSKEKNETFVIKADLLFEKANDTFFMFGKKCNQFLTH